MTEYNDEKLAAGYDDMTEDEQEAFDAQWKERKEDFMARKDKEQKDDWSLKEDLGYFKDMTVDQRAMFDQKMGEMKQGRDQDM